MMVLSHYLITTRDLSGKIKPLILNDSNVMLCEEEFVL